MLQMFELSFVFFPTIIMNQTHIRRRAKQFGGVSYTLQVRFYSAIINLIQTMKWNMLQ